MITKEQFDKIVDVVLQRGGKITIDIPAQKIEVSADVRDYSELLKFGARVDVPLYKFPNHAVMPTKPLVFDDASLVNGSDALDIARGKRPNSCWGCNEDDRGFVVVVGCPVHHSPNKKD